MLAEDGGGEPPAAAAAPMAAATAAAARECVVCMTAPRSAVLTACGHGVLCGECLQRMLSRPEPECPVC